MVREIIATEHAPQAIGTYSQAVRVGSTVYLSGQIPLDPASMQLVDQDNAGTGSSGIGQSQGRGPGSRR